MNGKSITVVDDYGHHPVELKATLAAAKGCWPDNRILTVFQPHRYSRTQDLFDDFVQVLSGEPNLFICDVYPAGEAPISTASSKALCQAIRQRGLTSPVLVSEVNELKSVLEPLIQDGDVVLTLGAGSIGKAVRDFCGQLSELSETQNQQGGGQDV
jgi:UDP-N-acetylmuramate--alanine ligase